MAEDTPDVMAHPPEEGHPFRNLQTGERVRVRFEPDGTVIMTDQDGNQGRMPYLELWNGYAPLDAAGGQSQPGVDHPVR
jgi:hypothetical protein